MLVSFFNFIGKKISCPFRIIYPKDTILQSKSFKKDCIEAYKNEE